MKKLTKFRKIEIKRIIKSKINQKIDEKLKNEIWEKLEHRTKKEQNRKRIEGIKKLDYTVPSV